MGEDGTVQGMLELAGVPYVGAGVLASALAWTRRRPRTCSHSHGLPQVRWLALRDTDVDDSLADRVASHLGWPVFVKPANLGSSVGVTKVAYGGRARRRGGHALRYDEYVLIEEAVTAREIECAVLGNADPRASLPGEVVPSHEFYDYEDKYVDGSAGLLVPAPLPPEVVAEVQRLAVEAYRALRVDGMARVDFFYEEPGRRLARERGEHDPRLHADLDVPEALGGVGHQLRQARRRARGARGGAPRPPLSFRHRALGHRFPFVR